MWSWSTSSRIASRTHVHIHAFIWKCDLIDTTTKEVMAAASGSQTTLDGRVAKRARMSYTREYKLEVVKAYQETNLYQTAKRFSLNTKTIERWVADVEKIKKSKKASKCVTHARRCQFPDLEEELYREYKKLWKQGFKVKGFWFRARAKQLLQRMHPDAIFQFSNAWFDGFKTRHKISLRGQQTLPKSLQLIREQQSNSSIERSEELLMKIDRQDQLAILSWSKSPTSTKHLCHFPSQVVEPTQIQVIRRCGSEVALPVLISNSVQHRLPYLPMESQQ